MASSYQRITALRQSKGARRNEDSVCWTPAIDQRPSHQRWLSDPRDEQVAAMANRSRSQTMTSAMSFYAASNSDSSTAPSRPVSPHLTRDKPAPVLERRESTAKALLSKGSRILRKHGSKFSLSSLHTVDSDSSERFTGRPSTTHTVTDTKERPTTVEALKREELKRTISEPFGFQHVTHTDRGFLDSIQRVPKTELVGEFSALRAGQASKPQLRGIRVEALPVQKPNDSPPDSPLSASDTEPSLPKSPPRPAPPQKDDVSALSSVQLTRVSRSVENFSRPTSSTISPVTPPRRYSSRRALQPSLNSLARPLGAYTHSASCSVDATGADSPQDFYANCTRADATSDKPLPGLPPIHAVTTSDDSARQLRVVPLPLIPLKLSDVLEEDELKRRPIVNRQADSNVASGSVAGAVSSRISTSSLDDDLTELSTNRTFMVDDWDDAIDYSWDHATEPEAADAQSPASMTTRVANFVDKAMTKLTGPEQTAPIPDEVAGTDLHEAKRPGDTSSHSDAPGPSTNDLATSDRSGSSPLLGLGIEVRESQQQVLEPCLTPTPVPGTGFSIDMNDRGSSQTASFDSSLSAVSGISKSSSQESIIWSIASSIIGTQRSSNSSSSLLEPMPDYQRAAEPIDDLKEALQSVQEHLQHIHDQSTDHSSHQALRPNRQPHRRAKSLASDFAFGNATPQRLANSRISSPRASHGHERVPSGSRIPVPRRKSSVKEQPEFDRPPVHRMRSATTATRSRHVSRASYSLFPGASPV